MLYEKLMLFLSLTMSKLKEVGKEVVESLYIKKGVRFPKRVKAKILNPGEQYMTKFDNDGIESLKRVHYKTSRPRLFERLGQELKSKSFRITKSSISLKARSNTKLKQNKRINLIASIRCAH